MLLAVRIAEIRAATVARMLNRGEKRLSVIPFLKPDDAPPKKKQTADISGP